MATVAGTRGERMLLRRRRLPLGDLTNLSPSTSVLTRLKPAARFKPHTSPNAGSSTSSIGSCASTAPRTRGTPPPPPPPPLSDAVIKGNDKAKRDVQSANSHLKKIKKISKPKEKTGDVLPGTSSPPSKKARKVTREEHPHMEPLDESSGEPLPSQDFIDQRRAYFAEVDAFELVEEFASSGSDLESIKFCLYSKKRIHYSAILYALYPMYIITKFKNLKCFLAQTFCPIQDLFLPLGLSR